MKTIGLFFFTVIVLFVTPMVHGQDFQIYRDSKTKTFKAGHMIKIELPNDQNHGCRSCPKSYLVGRLESYHQDTIQLRLKFERQPVRGKENEIGTDARLYRDKMEKEWPVIRVPSSSIVGITRQGIKKWRPNNAGQIVGRSLFTAGMLTIIIPAMVDGVDNHDPVVVTGASMILLGSVTAAVFKRKTYYIDFPLNTKVKGKTWKIK
jgi:hypothetical protein